MQADASACLCPVPDPYCFSLNHIPSYFPERGSLSCVQKRVCGAQG